MSMYQPGALRDFLRSLGVEPKKGLSQNFLIDGNILRKIVAEAVVKAGDVVIEIGPGPGALTEALLASGANVIAVDKDPVMTKALERLQTSDQRLKIICDDILNVDISALTKDRKVNVIANLPYHITTPILTSIIPLRENIHKIVVMVQDEVGKRITAHASDEDYSSLSVFSQFYANVKYAFKVSRNCFYPVPGVDSAVVVFELKEPPLTAEKDVERFFKLTRTAFGHRRKMMRSSLRELYTSEAVTQALEKIGLNPLARPEELSLDSFLVLYKELGQ